MVISQMAWGLELCMKHRTDWIYYCESKVVQLCLHWTIVRDEILNSPEACWLCSSLYVRFRLNFSAEFLKKQRKYNNRTREWSIYWRIMGLTNMAKVLKYLLLLFNLIFFICGIAMICIGAAISIKFEWVFFSVT